jgi:thiol:disulfide interchange protein
MTVRRGAVLALGALALVTMGTRALPARAQLEDSSTRVKVSALPAQGTVPPGGQVPVAVVFAMDEGWHTHTNAPVVPPELGDASFYYKTEVKPQLAGTPLDTCPDHIQWPEPVTVNVAFTGNPVPYKVFSGQAVAYVPVTVARDAKSGEVPVAFKVTYQACDETTCLAPVVDEVVQTKVAVATGAASAPANPELFKDFKTDVWDTVCREVYGTSAPTGVLAPGNGTGTVDTGWIKVNPTGAAGFALLLLVAMLGGLLLNFTPCVLPVIPLKIMSLSQAGGSWRRSFGLGLAMSAGVVTFWLALGLAIAFVSGFTAANQLFQYPLFTLGVGVFIAVMAVAMTGLFSVTLPQSVYKFNPGKESVTGSFMFGVLTAVLSTPCTAPFMGAAAAWAATQAPAITLLTFGAIGIGMALPYIVLSAFPQLVRKMPRSGPASELIKQVMGLLMLAAAAYFIGVGLSGLLAQPPEPPSRAYWWGVAFFVAAAGGWLAWQTLKIAHRRFNKVLFTGLGVAMVVGAVYMASAFTQHGAIPWVYYTPERLAQAKADGKVVVMEFTAEWCLNCKTLEETVLKDPRVVALLNDDDVVPMRVDLTGNNPVGNAMLKQVDRVTIPLLVVFAPDGSEVYKADFYTVDAVVAAIAEARKRGGGG